MVLTMAAQSYTTTPLHSKITNKPLCPPPLSLKPRSLTAKHLRTTQSTSLPRISVSAAATSSIEVKESSASIQPSKSKSLPFRVGHGFDLHRLEPGYPLIIGGINVPHERGCEAHSDGDVLLHCVVDAILGALGLPDIGQIFPDSDPKWKGAPSSVFIKEADSIWYSYSQVSMGVHNISGLAHDDLFAYRPYVCVYGEESLRKLKLAGL
ncbi:hypothetical protein CUMW_042400 [Citrus unshiu]|nr:hypothetical protein CUMW_042400 [Citrus unshiu]